MDLKQLEYYVRVAESGSFSRAAVELDVAQPALSRQVRLLETEFRQHLLERTGRGVVPTEAGRQLLEQSKGLLHQAQRLRDELGRARGALVGRVVIGMPPSFSRALAVPLTRAFRERLPDARLTLSEGLTVTMQAGLVAGRLDIGLLLGVTPRPEIDLEPLAEDPLVLVYRRRGAIDGVDRAAAGLSGSACAPALPLAELEALPLLIPSRPNALRMQIETELAALGRRPRIALEVDSVAAILDLVAEGAGCAVLSPHALGLAPAGAELARREIGEPLLASRLSLAVSARRPRSDTLAAAAAVVREVVGGLRAPPPGAAADRGTSSPRRAARKRRS